MFLGTNKKDLQFDPQWSSDGLGTTVLAAMYVLQNSTVKRRQESCWNCSCKHQNTISRPSIFAPLFTLTSEMIQSHYSALILYLLSLSYFLSPLVVLYESSKLSCLVWNRNSTRASFHCLVNTVEGRNDQSLFNACYAVTTVDLLRVFLKYFSL